MASTAHVGESRALVFPVMCNGYLQLDYSENNNSNYKHNLWGHKDEGFTFEAIVSPYDVNGIGHRTSGLGRLDSTKTPPSPNLSLDDHADTTSNYQSVSYFGSGRNTHKMMLFHNPYFQFYLENTTSSNFNQPAEYKLVCKLISGSKTHTIESDAVITSSNRLKGYYDSGGFYENGGLVSDKTQLTTTANVAFEQATVTISGNLDSFTNTEAVSPTLGTATITVANQPSTISGAMDVAGSAATNASAKITFSAGWSATAITPGTTASNNNAIILRNRQTGSGTSSNKTYRFFMTDASSSSAWPSEMQGSTARIHTFTDLGSITGGPMLQSQLSDLGYGSTNTQVDVFVPETGRVIINSNTINGANFRLMLFKAINDVNGSGSNPSSGLDITAITSNTTGATGVITLTQDGSGAAGNHSTTPNTGPVIGSSIANSGKLTATVFGDNSSDSSIVVGADAVGATTVPAKITIRMRGSSGQLLTRRFKFFSSGSNGTTTTSNGETVYRVIQGGNKNVTANQLAAAINTAFGSHAQFPSTVATSPSSGSNTDRVTITSPATGVQSSQVVQKTSHYNSVVTIGSSPFSDFVAGSSAVTPTAFITLTDSAGNVVRYKPSKGANGESTGSTGTENSGVTYFLNDTNSTTNTATNLRNAIASSNGHAQFSPAMNASSSSNVVTVSATAATGSHALARTSNMSSQVSVSSFSGGSGNAFSVSSGEADGIGAGNQVFNNAGVLVGTVSSVSGVNITLTASPATPITSTMYVSQPKEAMYIEQLNKVSCSFDKRHVNIYLNNILVQRKKLDIENFEFDDVDCYIGQDGSNTNTQFMGELYEVSMHKGLQPCSTISTLTPNFGDTLFYYTFGE